jgi:hypothetical protein
LLVFLADRDSVYFQTRQLASGGIVARPEDVTVPVVAPKREVLAECTSCLRRYLGDLSTQIPKVLGFDDYRESMAKLDAMTVRQSD